MTMLQERRGIHAEKQSPKRAPMPVFQTAEFANALTHGIGLLLSIAGAIVLVARSLSHGDTFRIVGCAIFATTLIAVYAASTLSHIPMRPQRRHWFRSLDQGLIYLLIVGTSTPFALAYLQTGWWYLFFALMWAVALCGFVSKILFSHRVEAVTVWSYILLGWMPIATVPSLVTVVPTAALWWMLIGGLCYTFGTLFLVQDHRHPLLHAVWHIFVIAGSTCHFVAIFFFVAVVPPRS